MTKPTAAAAPHPGAFAVFTLACIVFGFAVGVLIVAIVAQIAGA